MSELRCSKPYQLGEAGITRRAFILTRPGSHSASAEPPPSADILNAASSDADTDGTSGLKSVAGKSCLFCLLLSVTAAVGLTHF